MNGNQRGLEAVLDAHGLRLSRDVVQSVEAMIGKVVECEDLRGGVVHRVSRLRGAVGSVVVKQRLNRSYRIPTAVVKADDIVFEAAALTLFSTFAPFIWPQLHFLDLANHTLVLSDQAVPGHAEGPAFFSSSTPAEALAITKLLAMTLALHHKQAFSSGCASIRHDGDRAFFERNMFERISYHERGETAELATAVSRLPRQIIVGDFEPKNIFVGPTTVRCFDLEHVHAGSRAFDIAFFLGHVVLHRCEVDEPQLVAALVEAGIDSYNGVYPLDGDSALLVGPLLSATLAYRLRNPIVPYDLQLTTVSRHNRLCDLALRLVAARTLQVGDYIYGLLNEALEDD